MRVVVVLHVCHVQLDLVHVDFVLLAEVEQSGHELGAGVAAGPILVVVLAVHQFRAVPIHPEEDYIFILKRPSIQHQSGETQSKMAEIAFKSELRWPRMLSSGNFDVETPFWDLQIKNGVDGVILHVHKVVLCAASDFFARKRRYDRIRIKNVDSEVLGAVLGLIYNGGCRVADLVVAKKLIRKFDLRGNVTFKDPPREQDEQQMEAVEVDEREPKTFEERKSGRVRVSTYDTKYKEEIDSQYLAFNDCSE